VHLSLVSLIVDDVDDAIAFFVDVIGFQLVEDSPSMANDGTRKRWVVVQPPGGQTGVLLAQARGDRQVAGIGEQFVGRVGLFLTVDDFEEQYERMLAGGVQFTSEPRTEPYGQVAVWRDIAGNLWDLLGPPEAQTPG